MGRQQRPRAVVVAQSALPTATHPRAHLNCLGGFSGRADWVGFRALVPPFLALAGLGAVAVARWTYPDRDHGGGGPGGEPQPFYLIPLLEIPLMTGGYGEPVVTDGRERDRGQLPEPNTYCVMVYNFPVGSEARSASTYRPAVRSGRCGGAWVV